MPRSKKTAPEPRVAHKPVPADASRDCAEDIPNASPPDLDLLLQLLAIPGPSRKEAAVASFVREQLLRAGATAEQIQHDRAQQSSTGEVGNLVLKLPGTRRGPRRLLAAHLDTVPLCVGCRPELIRDAEHPRGLIRSADPKTALGADNRAGTAVLLHAASTILRQRLEHPPVTFLWTVQEEIGLCGARHVDLNLLGRPRLAFNWDGGPAEKITIGATGAYRFRIAIRGRASNAGNAPEKGVSAIAIAALAIADLQRAGWHGLIERGAKRGTSNVGIVQGGDATNVVAAQVEVRAEARSHDPKFRLTIAREIERVFARAAGEVRSVDGTRGQVEIERALEYESFLLPKDSPCIAAAEAAVRRAGGTPFRAIANGGLDANWITARGIPMVTLGCGQQNVHTVEERLDVATFERACRVALHLATATEGA